jgi:hypothetical protein
MACWLERLEERNHLLRLFGHEVPKTVPCLRGDYSIIRPFPDMPTRPHSILCLDESKSMEKHFASLVVVVNEYITTQREHGGLISVIQFDHEAHLIYEQGVDTITSQPTNGNTEFGPPLRLAIDIAKRSPLNYESRILFFTDGASETPISEIQKLKALGIRMDAIGFGNAVNERLSNLVICGGQMSIGRTMEDVHVAFRRIAAT